MWNALYNQFVRKNPNIRYEYERYVMEHIEEHKTNRLKQWKLLLALNIHYGIKKNTEPLIYTFKDNVPIYNPSIDSVLEQYIIPGINLHDRLLFEFGDNGTIFLCPYVGTGDVYLAAMYLKHYVEEKHIENYVVAVIGEGNRKVANLFDIKNVVKLQQVEADMLIRLAMFLGEDNHDIIVLHHDAPQVHFGILENFRNINGINFTNLLVNVVYNHGPEEYADEPHFEYNRNKIDKLLKQYGLQRGKTVILSPYANTLSLLPMWVWEQLAKELSEKGFSVVTNCGNKNEKPILGTIPIFFDYSISVPFIEACGYFVGIRSGLCDVISKARARKIVLYQPYVFWGEATSFDYFSLNKIGFCEDAIELEHHGVEFLDLLDEIEEKIFAETVCMTLESRKQKKDVEYIVVQAGGKGTRLKELTLNKPKALVPVNNLPILFHLFKKFPNAHYVIIGDYKYDVLEKYLAAFATVDYEIVNANGKTGTCGGIRQALEYIPIDTPFMLIWSDLVLPDDFSLEKVKGGNYIGISQSFPCRWKYENGEFVEERSDEYGVAGLFAFESKELLENVSNEGEFVRWLSERKDLMFDTVGLSRTKEYGIKEEYDYLKVEKCRPFNSIESFRGMIIKKPIDKQGKDLATKEIDWYKYVQKKGYQDIPRIVSFNPLVMESINGKNLYEYRDFSYAKKGEVLKSLVEQIKELHRLGDADFDRDSYYDAYIDKTLKRLEKVRELVPYAKEAYITINGKKCRNFFYHVDEVKALIESFEPSRFVFLHGDCTFSNMMLRDDETPIFIDPRGYFGKTKFYGDAAYDWAKLYYSLIGNYDQFNLKKFQLRYSDDGVELIIESSGWEDMESLFFELVKDEVTKTQIKLIHAIIWLSLTTYAWENYDSICGAFYNGLYYLEDVL